MQQIGYFECVTSPEHGLKHGLRALKHRDFALFWASSIASSSGTWLQNLAVPWVLFQITGSALWVGLAAAAQSIPFVVGSPLGGVIADRFDPRKVLLVTQTGLGAVALVQFTNWQWGLHEPALILTIVAFHGLFSGLNQPSWQSLVNQLVPREDLRSAITLNSMQFNLAKAIGPGLAGVLLATLGPGAAFLINALSTIAVIGALLAIRTRLVARRGAPVTVLGGLTSAAVYIARHPGLRLAVTISALVGLLGYPVFTFTIVLAEQAFDAGSGAVGALNACLGLGAVLMGPVLAGWEKFLPRGKVVAWALPAYGIAVMAFSQAPTLVVAACVLVVTGAAFFAASNSAHASAQMIVAEHMRGRVLALKLMSFQIAVSIGSAVQGAAADAWGARTVLVVAGAGLLLAGIALALLPPRNGLARLDDEQDLPA